MRILIEEYPYEAAVVKDILQGIDALENVEGRVSIHYVGYYYNTLLKDCVFILPKVLLKDGKEGKELAFGKYTPEAIVNLDADNPLNSEERNFLYKFAVWIYRAIVVYKNDKRNDTDIVYHATINQIGNGRKRLSSTYLDILLSLIRFNRENQSFFFFVIKNLHSGLNKINWTRTMATQTAIVQQGRPIYLNPVNKKRQINFDEELLVIYFSILNYIADTYGFPKELCCQFQLITGNRFETYLNGFGKTRLRQIKYKYYSDKALQLWDLCYAFFDEARIVHIHTEQREYLLVKSFYIVFEAIIDELVGDNPLPDGMEKKQEDGKIVDHLFTAQSLIDSESKQTYYIGDSKYYKMGHELGSESIYKQYTYARNVIQWNLDIFNSGQIPASGIQLRDEVTEGYNIIPNFFVSAKMDEHFDYTNDGIEKTDRRKNKHKQVQFANRLFDRDTLLLFHYDVNFLFVLSLYARNNTSQKQSWKDKVREKFRMEIQKWLQKDYSFYVMKAHPDVNGEEYIKQHFKELLGKVYTPFADKATYSLALDKDKVHETENNRLLQQLSRHFYLADCPLGCLPETVLGNVIAQGVAPSPEGKKDGVLLVMMENFEKKKASFLSHGKLAIGIKYTKDSMEIVEHLQSIGYVLFHHRSDSDQHLYAVRGECMIKSAEELEEQRYCNMKTTEMYLAADIDPTKELDASQLHSKKKSYSPTTRYDAQYTTIQDLIL